MTGWLATDPHRALRTRSPCSPEGSCWAPRRHGSQDHTLRVSVGTVPLGHGVWPSTGPGASGVSRGELEVLLDELWKEFLTEVIWKNPEKSEENENA